MSVNTPAEATSEHWRRFHPLALLLTSIIVPCVLGAATFPADAASGVLHIPGGHPSSGLLLGVFHGDTPSWWWLLFSVLALAGLVAAFLSRADHELLFGCLTVSVALTAIAVSFSVFASRQVENQSARSFLVMSLLGVTALSLIAHDWARRQLLIAAAVAAAALSLFIIRVGFESLNVPPQWERDQIASRAQVAENMLETQDTFPAAAATTQLDDTALNRAICAVKGCTDGKDTITSNSQWVETKHELDVQLAAYRAAVTGAAADEDALKAVLAQQPQVDEDISILAAIENGPDALWRSAFHATGPALVPGPLGWIIFGAALLGLLGYWLKINARQLAGPVDVESVNTGSADPDKELTTVLRVAVLRNVPEPGASPGSGSVNPVTNLLDIAGGPLTPVSKLVQTVLTVVGRRHGYQVGVDVVADTSAAAQGRAAALIRIKSVSGGATLAAHAFACANDREAVRAAGLWAAGYILARSSRIPSWAAWSAETAPALAAADNGGTPTASGLKEALKDVPNSGILLVLLGHEYEMDSERSAAINCYARAVTAHPRYPVARYRLAAAVAALRDKPDWDESESRPGERLDDLRALGPAIAAMNVKVDRPLSPLAGKYTLEDWVAKTDFTKLAITLLRRLENDMRYRYRLVSAMRRSERDFVWPGLGWNSSTIASRFREVVVSARMALENDLARLKKKAAKPDSWWQISYNAACGYASARSDQPEQALALLEQTLVRPNVHQLSAAWARKDPDLGNLRKCRRFQWFLDQLAPGDGERKDGHASPGQKQDP
jgi:hypothetical protein